MKFSITMLATLLASSSVDARSTAPAAAPTYIEPPQCTKAYPTASTYSTSAYAVSTSSTPSYATPAEYATATREPPLILATTSTSCLSSSTGCYPTVSVTVDRHGNTVAYSPTDYLTPTTYKTSSRGSPTATINVANSAPNHSGATRMGGRQVFVTTVLTALFFAY